MIIPLNLLTFILRSCELSTMQDVPCVLKKDIILLLVRAVFYRYVLDTVGLHYLLSLLSPLFLPSCFIHY